jgi:hypothetical protein
MLNSGSCDLYGAAFSDSEARRVGAAARRLAEAADGRADDESLERVSRDFAAVMYTTVLKEMQKTTWSEEGEEEKALGQAARDFVAMFLPQAIADQPNDALTRYILQGIRRLQGGAVDESA